MRVLAMTAFSFAAAFLTAALMEETGWYLYAAAALLMLAVIAFFLRKRRKLWSRVALLAISAAAALAYFTGYQALVQQPVLDKCGQEQPFTGVVCDYAIETDYGARVTVHLDGSLLRKATLYGDASLLELRPGNTVSGTAKWNDAAHIRDTRLTTFTSRGVFALLYQKGELSVEEGTADSARWWPVRMNRAFQERIRAIWPDERIAAFVTAELTGDKYDISDEDYTIMRGAGLAHLFAVSGLHCAFLVTLLALLLPRHRRRLFCGVTIGVLVFYMCMVGMTPSVVRACVMQGFLLLAPLFRRDGDPLTSLGAALLLILLPNPFAAASVSLQLSFAATFGIVLLSGRLYHLLFDWYQGDNKHIRRVLSFGCANLAVSLSAMICTVPLVAYYFNTLSLVSPLASLLAVPLAGYAFMASFVTVLAGFAWLPLARALGWISYGLIRLVLWIAYVLTRWRVSRGLFRQSLSAYLAGGSLYGLRPVRGGEALAQAEVPVCRGGMRGAAGTGHLGQYPRLPQRQHERDGAGRGAGRERGAVLRRTGDAGGLRQLQQLCGRGHCGGGCTDFHGLFPSEGGGGHPFPRRPHQRPLHAAEPSEGGYPVPAGHGG